MCVSSPQLEGLVSLNLLDLNGNLFSSVPRHLPRTVQQLYLSNNTLSGLDEDSFVGFHNLKYLRLSHCGLQSRGVHPQVFNFSSLVELDLSYNKLTTIPTVPTTLQYLYLEANEIQGEMHTYTKKTCTHEETTCSHLSLCECSSVTDYKSMKCSFLTHVHTCIQFTDQQYTLFL